MKRPEEYLLQTLPQICTASAQANIKHGPKLMQYRFAVIYETVVYLLQNLPQICTASA